MHLIVHMLGEIDKGGGGGGGERSELRGRKDRGRVRGRESHTYNVQLTYYPN